MRHNRQGLPAKYGAAIALVGGIALSAPIVAFGSPASPAVAGHAARLAITNCMFQPGDPQSPTGACTNRNTFTFSSSCMSARVEHATQTSGIVTSLGEQMVTGWRMRHSPLGNGTFQNDGDFTTGNGITISWRGTNPKQFSGVGYGTWAAANLPRRCTTPGGSDSGSFRSVSTTTTTASGQIAIETITLYDFPHAGATERNRV